MLLPTGGDTCELWVAAWSHNIPLPVETLRLRISVQICEGLTEIIHIYCGSNQGINSANTTAQQLDRRLIILIDIVWIWTTWLLKDGYHGFLMLFHKERSDITRGSGFIHRYVVLFKTLTRISLKVSGWLEIFIYYLKTFFSVLLWRYMQAIAPAPLGGIWAVWISCRSIASPRTPISSLKLHLYPFVRSNPPLTQCLNYLHSNFCTSYYWSIESVCIFALRILFEIISITLDMN